MQISELIKKARTDKKMSQQQLADAVFVSKQAISQYEKGHSEPKLKVKQKLYEVLDLSSSNLLRESEVEYRATAPKPKQVPIYNIELSPGMMTSLEDNWENNFPVGYLSIPEVAGCDAIIKAKGDSMAPKIDAGDWLGIKRIENWREWLPMNRIYVIYTDDFELVNYIEKGSTDEYFNLAFSNKLYKSEEIPIALIREIWAVKAILPFSKSETLI